MAFAFVIAAVLTLGGLHSDRRADRNSGARSHKAWRW
jgi:hypothetical protein